MKNHLLWFLFFRYLFKKGQHFFAPPFTRTFISQTYSMIPAWVDLAQMRDACVLKRLFKPCSIADRYGSVVLIGKRINRRVGGCDVCFYRKQLPQVGRAVCKV